eukprot:3021722-Pyramimonas_sp.AAC.1
MLEGRTRRRLTRAYTLMVQHLLSYLSVSPPCRGPRRECGRAGAYVAHEPGQARPHYCCRVVALVTLLRSTTRSTTHSDASREHAGPMWREQCVESVRAGAARR